jgi:hypothetical protein
MFGGSAAPKTHASHHAKQNDAALSHHRDDDDHHAPPSEQDCAAMTLAKSVAPVTPKAVAPAPLEMPMPAGPDATTLLQPPRLAGVSARPRGPPPRNCGGFPAIFARNHRLLI